MFDTHCHLNFIAFDGRVGNVIDEAKQAGVNQIIIPGTDVKTSKKAVEIAEIYEDIYVAVGIHPHHIFEMTTQSEKITFASDLKNIENLLKNKKVIAIGEVGIDRHVYQKTKYLNYKIAEKFVTLQKVFLKEQIKLAIKYDKSLILHNREAREDMFEVLREVWDKRLEGRAVFHCCEPDRLLLEFAKQHKMFIGVDGDVIYDTAKQQFIKTVPLEMLLLETDSPFLSPIKQFPNEPKNIVLIVKCVAKLLHCSTEKVAEITTNNAKKLINCFTISTKTLS
jgi:TatD DNase family protein